MEYYAILKINNPKAPIFSRITTNYIAIRNKTWLKSIGIESEILPIYVGSLDYEMSIRETLGEYKLRSLIVNERGLAYATRGELIAAFQTELLHKVDILDNVYETFLEVTERLKFDPNGYYEPQYNDEGYRYETIHKTGTIRNLFIVDGRAREIDNL